MLQRLKAECGDNTVYKLAQMLTDIKNSKEMMILFKQSTNSLEIETTDGVEFSAEILSIGHWSLNEQQVCILPSELKDMTMSFDSFYNQKYKKIKLKWFLNHGSVEIKPVFITSKSYTFVTNCYQAIILMLFNNYDELTFTQVKEMTNIEEREIVNALIFLCNPKKKIIDKENAKKPEFLPQTKLKVTIDFINSNTRVVFLPKSQQNSKDSQNEMAIDFDNSEDIKNERKKVIDSVIVSVMKAQKTEKHN